MGKFQQNNFSFAKAAVANIQRSKFRRPSTHKTTFDANQLVPVFVDEVLPGDTFDLKASHFARLATPIKPSMDELYMDIHYFFVPNRLVWSNWEKFMGEQDNPSDSIDYLVPTIPVSFNNVGEHTNSIFDYFGVPFVDSATGSVDVNALPFRAYNLIWNEWYRDQNLQDSVTEDFDDNDVMTNYSILNRNKKHDYFTSALPFPQKGEAVDLPLGSQAPIKTDVARGGINSLGILDVNDVESRIDVASPSLYINAADPATTLYADLSGATSATINQLRQAFQLQKFLERDARGGTRYIEIIKSHFGVTNPDFRLQRPEYLGGTHSDIEMTTIAQTGPTQTGVTPQGNLAAMGVAFDSKRVFNKSFTEHGFIIGLASVYAPNTYQQGLNRMWSRSTRYDYFWPSFAHLGEQAIFNKEIYCDGSSSDDSTFGYQERYAEYRYMPSRISGLFRSSATNSLDVWHYAQDFANLPVLNSSFIEMDSPIDRNIAVTTEPQFIADFNFNLTTVRPMPMYGTPGFVDRY